MGGTKIEEGGGLRSTCSLHEAVKPLWIKKIHVESEAPFYGGLRMHSSYVVYTCGALVERVEDDQVQYLEVPHDRMDCAHQEAH